MREAHRVSASFGLLGVAALLTLVGSIGCQREAESPRPANEKQIATRTVAVPVSGMICQICAGQVKAALKEVRGVRDVEISLENRNAVIRYVDGEVSMDQVTRAITELGYKTGAPTPIASQ